MAVSGSKIAGEHWGVHENTARRLPLPLAQLCRRAANCKTIIDAHLTAFSLAETTIKLLSSAAIVHYAEQPTHDPELVDCLKKLARPSLGHWWEFARRLIPVLAERHAAYAHTRSMLLERIHDDCVRAAGLNAAMLAALGRKPPAGLTVRFRELFDNVVEYRNKVLFHAAPSALPVELHRQMAGAFLKGMGEVLGKLDVLGGSQLTYVGDVRQSQGQWLVMRWDLTGEHPRRQPAQELPRSAAAELPDGDRVYLAGNDGRLRLLHPFVIYDAEHEEVLLLNARRGSARSEYLCYTSGRTEERPDLGDDQRRLLADVLGVKVSPEQVDAWARASRSEDAAGHEEPNPAAYKTLGEFELISELGRGGMGVVYRALQPSLRREVALKKLLRTSGGSEQRFLREIRALGRVEHPHLIKILTSGSVGEEWYYAMELVDGVPLSNVCSKLQHAGSAVADLDLSTWQAALTTACSEVRHNERPLSHASLAAGAPPAHVRPITSTEMPQRFKAGRDYIERIVVLMRQVAGALDALHEAGIIHRDVKPGNVMVSADGERALLMDLGLAQLADEEEGRLTRTRQFVGTLRYASPEQVLAAERLNRRSDIYSLGATLWELLTLHPLFDASDNVPEAEVMRRIQLDEPGSVRRYNPRVDRDLDAIIAKCLEKRPERRYATARELAEDLRRWQRNEPVLARRVTRLEKTARWFARRPALASACAFGLLTVILGAGGGVAAWGYLRAERAAKELAEVNAQLASTNRQLESAIETAETEEENARRAEQDARRAEAEVRRARDALVEKNREILATQAQLQRIGYADQVLLAHNMWQMGDEVRARDRLRECDSALRGWEWQFLKTTFEERELEATPLLGRNMTVAVDGRAGRVAVADQSGTIRILNAAALNSETGGLAAPLELQTGSGAARLLAFSENGTRLASVSAGNQVQVFDAETGTVVGAAPPLESNVQRVAVGPEGRLLAVACEDDVLHVYSLVDPSDGRFTERFRGTRHQDDVTALVFSADERSLFSADYDGLLLLWNAETGELSGDFGAEALRGADNARTPVSHVVLSPDGRWLASCSSSGDISLWSVADRQQRAQFVRSTDADATAASNFISGLVFSPDGKRLAALESSNIALWTVPHNPEQPPGTNSLPQIPPDFVLQGHTEWVYAARFSPDGLTLATTGADQSIRLWNFVDGSSIIVTRALPADGRELSFRPDAAELISVDAGGGVRRWDVAVAPTMRKHTLLLTGHTDRINQLAYSPDGRRLASAGNDGTVRVWDTELGRLLHSINVRPQGDSLYSYEWVNRVSFGPDGTRLAVASDAGRIQLWDPEAGALAFELQRPPSKSGNFALNGLTRTVAFSPEVMRVAIGNADGSIQVWDASAGTPPAILRGHAGEINCLSFDPRGQRLASAGSDASVTIWNAGSGQLESRLLGHDGPVNCVAFSPDGTLAATGGRDRTVRLWKPAESNEPLWSADAHGPKLEFLDPLGIVGLTFDPRGDRLLSAGDDGNVLIWDVARGTVIGRLEGHSHIVRDIAFSPDGKRIATASGDYTARLWDADTGALLHVLQDPRAAAGSQPPRYGHVDWVNTVAFSPDGAWLATGSDDRTVQIWDVNSGAHLQTFGSHEDWIRSIAISPDGRYLISACDDQRVRIWDVSHVMDDIAPEAPRPQGVGELFSSASLDPGPEPLQVYQGHNGIVRFARFTRDGRQVLSAVTGYAPDAHLWNLEDTRKLAEFKGESDGSANVPTMLAFSPTGEWLASTALNPKAIQVWSVATGEEHALLSQHPRSVTCFDFSPDGTLLASGCQDGVLRLWKVATGELFAALEGHAPQQDRFTADGGIRHLAFSPDGLIVVTAGGDRTVRAWDVHGRRLLRTFSGHQSEVDHVVFSPDGRTVVSCSADEAAIAWNVASGQSRAVLKGHDRPIVAAAFSPAGSRLLTAGSDGTLRLWDVEAARPLIVFRQFEAAAESAPAFTFRPDGLQFAATSADNVIQLLQAEESPAQAIERHRHWRRGAVDLAQSSREWAAGLFHLKYLLAELPDEAALNYQRGSMLAELERWSEARDAFARTLDLVSSHAGDQCIVYLRLGLTDLARGDADAYRQAVQRLIETAETAWRSGNSSPDNPIYAAWLAAVRPDALTDWNTVVRLAEEAVQAAPDDLFYQETFGLLLYRAGEFGRAADNLLHVQNAAPSGANADALFVLALSLHRLGRTSEGLRWYTEALRKLGEWQDAPADDNPAATAYDAAPAPPPAVSWEVRERRRYLRAEADQVFVEEIAPPAPAS